MDEKHAAALPAMREIRTCSVCGTKFSAISNVECCPVCVLRCAVSGHKLSPLPDRMSASETGLTLGNPKGSLLDLKIKSSQSATMANRSS